MSAILLIKEMPKTCKECPCQLMFVCVPADEDIDEYVDPNETKPDWCPLKPLNKIVKAGDRNLIIYERAWLYSHLEEEFEMQKKVRDWEKQNDGQKVHS